MSSRISASSLVVPNAGPLLTYAPNTAGPILYYNDVTPHLPQNFALNSPLSTQLHIYTFPPYNGLHHLCIYVYPSGFNMYLESNYMLNAYQSEYLMTTPGLNDYGATFGLPFQEIIEYGAAPAMDFPLPQYFQSIPESTPYYNYTVQYLPQNYGVNNHGITLSFAIPPYAGINTNGAASFTAEPLQQYTPYISESSSDYNSETQDLSENNAVLQNTTNSQEQENGTEMTQNDTKCFNTKVIVKYLPATMTTDELKNLFSRVGEVTSCKIIMDRHTGLSRGFGFVSFVRPNDAERAINDLNGLRVANKTIKVSYARSNYDAINGSNLYIQGLPLTFTENDLEEMLSAYGRIIHCHICCDRTTGLSKGTAFVRFYQRTEAVQAIRSLNKVKLEADALPMIVRFANDSNDRTFRSPSRRRRHRPGTPATPAMAPLSNSPVTENMQANSQIIDVSREQIIFIGNLARDTTDNLLWQLFSPFGEVSSVKIMRHQDTKKCAGYAFVKMAKYDEAVAAIQRLNGHTIGNRVLKVDFKNKHGTNAMVRKS